MSSCENRQLVSAVKIIFIRDRYKTLDRKEKKIGPAEKFSTGKKEPDRSKTSSSGR